MNILVTGASGQLGSELKVASNGAADRYLFTDVNTNTPGTEFLDITDPEAVRGFVEANEVDIVVNCAAWTNVDACETDIQAAELARKLNAKAPALLAEVMKETGGLIIHISTDYVYGRETYNTPCGPDMKGTPSGVYGATKLEGEENIISSGCRYIILRTSWLYSEYGNNFCKKMLELTGSRRNLKVVIDQCGTPTYALDLAEAIVKIITDRSFENQSGIYNYSNEGVTSWYDFAKMIAGIAGHNNCVIEPCRSIDFPSPVKRPAYSVLDKELTKKRFGVEVPYWVDSLKKCIDNISHEHSANSY